MKKVTFLLVLSFIAFASFAQDLSQYQKGEFISKNDTLKYRILYPKNFVDTKQYPIILFLHGRGESGNDNKKQLTHGGKLFLSDNFRNENEVITIFPQCADDSYWANVQIDVASDKRFFNFIKDGPPTKSMALLQAFTNYFFKQNIVDKRRIYVGGLSMGAMGTFEMLRRNPNTFAAAFAICGGDNVANVKKYKHVPLWIFHGALDDVVSPHFSYQIFKTLSDLGNAPKFTIYPKANHNSWDSAFAEPNLLPWLLSHKK